MEENKSFKTFIDKVSIEGMELISGFMDVCENAGFLVTPLLIGDKENQVGFSIVYNRNK